MLRSLYANVPVPSFYQDLALLVREQYFPLIVTMNFDTLLEQALAGAGIRSSEYRVTTFDQRRTSSGPSSGSLPPQLTHLVKLHGDLAQDVAHLSPQEIESALVTSKQWIRADLAGDLVMVAHVIGDEPIDHWLALSPKRELWWVSQNPPADRPQVETWSEGVEEITGEIGTPQVFFSQLALRLLRAPEVVAVEEPAGADSPYVALRHFDQGSTVVSLADSLHREILRSQSVLSSLEQQRASGQQNPQLLAQIQYQKKQLSGLEDRILSLPDIKLRLVYLVNTIVGGIRDAPEAVATGSGDVAEYLQHQAHALEKELGQQQPNQALVSATLGATLAAANRLHTEFGDEVVRAEDLNQLAVLVPTLAAKAVV